MASDIRQPADDSHLHDDPDVLARWHDQEATGWWDLMEEARRCGREDERRALMDAFEHHDKAAREYRRLAARGERVPKF